MRERGQEVAFGLALLAALAVGVGLELGFRALRGEAVVSGVDWGRMVAAIGETDPETGRARFAPGARFGEMVFNSYGLRGPEVAMPQPPDLVRIAFLGDSKVMSAEYSEAQSFSAQVVARLEEVVPQCRFDYLTMAGPGYTVPVITDLWSEIAPATGPDFAVVLAGTVTEMASAVWTSGRGPSGRQSWLDGLLADSWVLAAAQRHLYALSARIAPPPVLSVDHDLLSQTHRANFAPLVAALGDTPVLALGYRGRLRLDQPLDDQARFARDLQFVLPGLTVTEAILLTELNVASLEALAQEAGWSFSDPIADLPTDESHFGDNQHFTALGMSRIAVPIAAMIAARIEPDCTIARHHGFAVAE